VSRLWSLLASANGLGNDRSDQTQLKQITRHRSSSTRTPVGSSLVTSHYGYGATASNNGNATRNRTIEGLTPAESKGG
jgi:hypothetical protein